MKRNADRMVIGTGVLALTMIGLLLSGCSSPARQSGTAAGPSTARGNAVGANRGAELWAQTCNRCHNIRSPNSLSDSQWDVAMLHMRIRADLTAEEYRQILPFLKSAH